MLHRARKVAKVFKNFAEVVNTNRHSRMVRA